MIKDLIRNKKNNLYINGIKKSNDIKKTTFQMVNFSQKIKNSENEIRFFLKTKMYNNKNVLKKNDKGKLIIKKLFSEIKKRPEKYISKNQLNDNNFRAIADFISGMTDRYAITL